MKPRIFLIAAVGVIAGVLAWYMYSSTSGSALKSADAAKPAPAAAKPVAPAPVVASAVPAQVAKPVVAAVPAAAGATPGPSTEGVVFVAGPQSDLKTCVAATIHFLEGQDISSLVQTIMPPDAIKRMIDSGQATSIEDIANHYRQMPDVASKMDQLLQGLRSVQDQAPAMNEDGTQATYKLDTAVTGPGKPDAQAGTPGNITFIKIDGNWYLR